MRADITHVGLVAAVRDGASAPPAERMRVIARAYARLGLRVLPLWHVLDDGSCACPNREHAPGGRDAGRAGKHPRNSGGVSKASRDPQTIDSWWRTWPLAGIGIATGNGIDVIDVDSRSALQEIADLIAAGRLPRASAWVRSGRTGAEGVHIVVPSRAKTGNAQGLIPGVDYRAEGGYIVAAPTRHRSLRAYEWLSEDPLPRGNSDRGKVAPVTLPWERPHAATSGVGPREKAWAETRLARQAAHVRSAAEKRRNRAVYDAAYRMGARVQKGWISRARVEEVLMSAYRDAGGQDPDTVHALSRGLANSAHNEVRSLPDTSTQDVSTVLRLIGAWAGTAAARKSLHWSYRPVLEWFLEEARASQSLVVRAAEREIMLGANSTKGTVGRAKKALLGLGVLETVRKGSNRGREAAIFRLTVPGKSSQGGALVSAQPPVPSGDVPHLEKEPAQAAAVASKNLEVLRHSSWNGARRGYGHGLTHGDRALLAALPPDGAPIRIADWVRKAEVSLSSGYRAADARVRGSLSAHELIQRCHGGVRATPHGVQIVQAVCGDASLDALDALAETLGVGGRADERAQRVQAERDTHERGLLPSVVIGALLGREGQRRDARSMRNLLEPEADCALNRLLLELDSTLEGARGRAPVARIVTSALGRDEDTLPSEDDLRAAGVPGDALGRLLSPVWVPCPRVLDMAAVAAGLRLALDPPTGHVDAATGVRLSRPEAEAADAAGAQILLVRAAVSDLDWAKGQVAAEFFIDPLPSIAEVMEELKEVRHPRAMTARGATPSAGYAAVTPAGGPAALPWCLAPGQEA